MNAIISTNGHGSRLAAPAAPAARRKPPKPTSAVVCPFYSKADLAVIFGVCTRTIEKWMTTERLPAPRKVGRKWTAWPKAEIDTLLADWGKS